MVTANKHIFIHTFMVEVDYIILILNSTHRSKLIKYECWPWFNSKSFCVPIAFVSDKMNLIDLLN